MSFIPAKIPGMSPPDESSTRVDDSSISPEGASREVVMLSGAKHPPAQPVFAQGLARHGLRWSAATSSPGEFAQARHPVVYLEVIVTSRLRTRHPGTLTLE
jgi:hypothetical protein